MGSAPSRQRLLEAMAAALRHSPYAEVTVADIVRIAGVSRRTFYEHFDDRTACLEAMLHESNRADIAHIAAAVDPKADWRSQVRQAVEAWVGCVARDPEVALSWIRVVPSLGERGRRHAREEMAQYADLIRGLVDRPEIAGLGIEPLTAAEALMILGGLRELMATAVEDGGDLTEVAEVATRVTTRVLAPGAG